MVDLNSCIFPEILSEVGTTTFCGQDFLSDSVKTSCDILNLHMNFSSHEQRTNQAKDGV